MKCPTVMEHETERLKALASYGLGSDRPLPSLDNVVRIAVRMFDMPVAAVNMVGSDHVFFAASVGVGEVDMRRDVSFCAHAITQGDVMVVHDTTQDERFHDNPLVTGPSKVRFYAGVPLLSPEGLPLGALCVLDNKPHAEFSQSDGDRLRELAQMAIDRLELRRIEVASEKARPSFGECARSAQTPVIWFDEDGTILLWNDAAAALHGYDTAEGVGMALERLIPEPDRPGFRNLIQRAREAGSLDGMGGLPEVSGLRKDGSVFRLNCALFATNENGRLKFSAVLTDMSAREKREAELQRLATTDVLTGLSNRGQFYRETEAVLCKPMSAAVVMIDLDGFKDVNDTLGHSVGDGILREVAARLKGCARAADAVARIGGDEFAILMPDVDDLDLATQMGHAVNMAVAGPITVDGHEIRIAASCGVAVAPLHTHEALELIGGADLALCKAKSTGRGQSFAFVPALRMEAMARRMYSMELHRAVEAGEFLLYYQPQISMADGQLIGAEALIRWRHPERGILSPGAFLPALEGGPLAATVGAWALEEACMQTSLWRRQGAENFQMGVNLFGAQFQVGDLVRDVTAALERHGLPANALELEITENIVLDHDDTVLTCLKQLRQLGVGIAFDDFGTGYASLSLLKQYPLTRIKIDQSFVRGMLASKQDRAVIRAVLDMADSFDLAVIAEGIETELQQDALLLEGCKEGQGYLYGKPMPAEEFAHAFGFGPPRRRVAGRAS